MHAHKAGEIGIVHAHETTEIDIVHVHETTEIGIMHAHEAAEIGSLHTHKAAEIGSLHAHEAAEIGIVHAHKAGEIGIVHAHKAGEIGIVASWMLISRVKIDGGLGVWPPWSSGRPPLEKCQNGAGGSVLGNFQLNNSLTHSNFRYFTFSGKNIKIRPPWKNLTLPGKKV